MADPEMSPLSQAGSSRASTRKRRTVPEGPSQGDKNSAQGEEERRRKSTLESVAHNEVYTTENMHQRKLTWLQQIKNALETASNVACRGTVTETRTTQGHLRGPPTHMETIVEMAEAIKLQVMDALYPPALLASPKELLSGYFRWP